MGKRGPKPKPTILKVLEGNPGRRPLNDREAQPEPGRPACPQRLKGPVRRWWYQIGKQLDECGLFTKVDGPAFEMLTQAYADWREAIVAMEERGPVWMEKGEGGIPEFAYSPWLKVAEKAAARLHAMLREFGMTPSARSTIKTAGPAEKPKEQPAAKYFA